MNTNGKTRLINESVVARQLADAAIFPRSNAAGDTFGVLALIDGERSPA